MELINTSLYQRLEQVVETAIQEDANRLLVRAVCIRLNHELGWPSCALVDCTA